MANGVERDRGRDISKRYITSGGPSIPKTKGPRTTGPLVPRTPRALVGHTVANQDELAAPIGGGGPVHGALHRPVVIAVAQLSPLAEAVAPQDEDLLGADV